MPRAAVQCPSECPLQLPIPFGDRVGLRAPLLERLHVKSSADIKEEDRRRQIRVAEGDLAYTLERGSPERVGNVYRHVFKYRGRYVVRAPLLHVAMYLEKLEAVKEVTKQLLNINVKLASLRTEFYMEKEGYFVSLNSFVMAAGMGNISVMEALCTSLVPHKIKEELVNKDAGKVYTSADCERPLHISQLPLHEACRHGHVDMVRWLLNKGPDPKQKNMGVDADYWTKALHAFVAAGRFEGSTHNIKEVTVHMINMKADLTSSVVYPLHFSEKVTPLQMAVHHSSKYPKELMYILAPSFQLAHAREGCHRSLVRDLNALTRNSPKAAAELVDQMFRDNEQQKRVLVHLKNDVQSPDVVALLVKLISSSPVAAVKLLQKLAQQPFIQDPIRHSIPTRANLRSAMGNVALRCAYQADAVRCKNGSVCPAWLCEIESKKVRTPRWHSRLMRINAVEHPDSVYDVKVFVVPVPNLLSVELMLILATTSQLHLKIFANITIHGIVKVMWTQFTEYVNAVQIIMLVLLELGPLLTWGLTVNGYGPFSRLTQLDTEHNGTHNSPLSVTFVWSMLAGILVSEIVSIALWLVSFWHMAIQKRGTTNLPINEQIKQVRNVMFKNHMILDVILIVSLFLLLVSTHDCNAFQNQPVSYTAQGMLAWNVFVRFVKLISTFSSIHTVGPSVIAVVSTFMSGSMRSMFFMLGSFYIAFLCVFAVLRREHNVFWLGIYLYRHLFYGDGDGLDRFGLGDPEKNKLKGDRHQDAWLFFYGLSSSVLFSLVFLNLTIAVYADEYKTQRKKADLHFLQERARISAKIMRLCYPIGARFPWCREWWLWCALAVMWALMCLLGKRYKIPFIFIYPALLLFGAARLSFLTWLYHLRGWVPGAWSLGPTHMQEHFRDTVVVESAIQSEEGLEVGIRGVKIPHPPDSFLDSCTLEYSCRVKRLASVMQRDKVKPTRIIRQHSKDEECARATLIFEHVQSMDHDAMVLSCPRAKPVTFSLTRFLWICHRDDYNENFFDYEEVDAKLLDRTRQSVCDELERIQAAGQETKHSILRQLRELNSQR